MCGCRRADCRICYPINDLLFPLTVAPCGAISLDCNCKICEDVRSDQIYVLQHHGLGRCAGTWGCMGECIIGRCPCGGCDGSCVNAYPELNCRRWHRYSISCTIKEYIAYRSHSARKVRKSLTFNPHHVVRNYVQAHYKYRGYPGYDKINIYLEKREMRHTAHKRDLAECARLGREAGLAGIRRILNV